MTPATIKGFTIRETIGGYIVLANALPEDFCEDYQGNGTTIAIAFADLLEQMARDGKLKIEYIDLHAGHYWWPKYVRVDKS
jgi:hypothetical protein